MYTTSKAFFMNSRSTHEGCLILDLSAAHVRKVIPTGMKPSSQATATLSPGVRGSRAIRRPLPRIGKASHT
ncbi:hypothetical protein DPMN_104414 [Dreissena polymorpha]|uniref:Uncharacterized protein n=1 Tax=Dreissena polymorpha TaxID=45954 RepID=A0A9D4HFN7_DREPO|nr:hypothetical protein DPMN_104414 [Dreissena polymorpha]